PANCARLGDFTLGWYASRLQRFGGGGFGSVQWRTLESGGGRLYVASRRLVNFRFLAALGMTERKANANADSSASLRNDRKNSDSRDRTFVARKVRTVRA